MTIDSSRSATENSYTFVLVHGGCHDGSLWEPVIARLEQLGHTAFGPTVAGHGKGVPKNVTHADETQSIVDFIVDRDLTDFILVGHGYAGTIVSKVVEAIPERVRRLVFWSAYVLNDGETALEMLPDSVEMLTQMAADSADNDGKVIRPARRRTPGTGRPRAGRGVTRSVIVQPRSASRPTRDASGPGGRPAVSNTRCRRSALQWAGCRAGSHRDHAPWRRGRISVTGGSWVLRSRRALRAAAMSAATSAR